jgi:hypothetical protein
MHSRSNLHNECIGDTAQGSMHARQPFSRELAAAHIDTNSVFAKAQSSPTNDNKIKSHNKIDITGKRGIYEC